MTERTLAPEACLDLKIHLDRLHEAEERCREGLDRLSNGELTRESYGELLRRQRLAQSTWEDRQRRYFTTGSLQRSGPNGHDPSRSVSGR
jgi:hypothetical protein